MACSASTTNYRSAAQEVIEGEIADQAALGELKASCDEPAGTEVGTTFPCTAQTPDGETIEVSAVIAEDDKVQVETTNLILATGLRQIEKISVAALEREVGGTLGVENFTCGDTALVIDVTSEVMTCILTDPDSGEEYDAAVDIPGLDRIEDLSVQVSDTPRS